MSSPQTFMAHDMGIIGPEGPKITTLNVIRKTIQFGGNNFLCLSTNGDNGHNLVWAFIKLLENPSDATKQSPYVTSCTMENTSLARRGPTSSLKETHSNASLSPPLAQPSGSTAANHDRYRRSGWPMTSLLNQQQCRLHFCILIVFQLLKSTIIDRGVILVGNNELRADQTVSRLRVEHAGLSNHRMAVCLFIVVWPFMSIVCVPRCLKAQNNGWEILSQ